MKSFLDESVIHEIKTTISGEHPVELYKLEYCMEEGSRYTPLNNIYLKYSEMCEILKVFNTTGRLYFKAQHPFSLEDKVYVDCEPSSIHFLKHEKMSCQVSACMALPKAVKNVPKVWVRREWDEFIGRYDSIMLDFRYRYAPREAREEVVKKAEQDVLALIKEFGMTVELGPTPELES